MYDAETGSLLWELPDFMSLGAFSPDGALVALGDGGGNIHLCDAVTGVTWTILPTHGNLTTGISWSASDTLVAATWTDGEVFGWPDSSRSMSSSEPPLTARISGVPALEWAPNSRVLLSAHVDYKARLWNQDLEVLREFDHDGVVADVTWSPDGSRFATLADDGLLRVWGLPEP